MHPPRKRRRVTLSTKRSHEQDTVRPGSPSFRGAIEGLRVATTALPLTANPVRLLYHIRKRTGLKLYVTTQTEDDDAPAQTTWTNPDTGEIFVVDTRTGNSYPAHNQQQGRLPLHRRRTIAIKPSTRISSSKGGEDLEGIEDMPDWIRTALQVRRRDNAEAWNRIGIYQRRSRQTKLMPSPSHEYQLSPTWLPFQPMRTAVITL